MTCPYMKCGARVPFGGGQTVKDAANMATIAFAVGEALIKPDLADKVSPDEMATLYHFAKYGLDFSQHLHAYGHKPTIVPPDLDEAIEWVRTAGYYLQYI